MDALGGTDKIYALGGDDIVYGGNGKDNISGGDGGDLVYGGAGNDTISGGLRIGTENTFLDLNFNCNLEDAIVLGDQNLDGGDGEDRLIGSQDNDLLRGGPGKNLLSGGEGDDCLLTTYDEPNGSASGGGGDDIIYAQDGNRDYVYCGEGHDTVEADESDMVSPDCERSCTQSHRRRRVARKKRRPPLRSPRSKLLSTGSRGAAQGLLTTKRRSRRRVARDGTGASFEGPGLILAASAPFLARQRGCGVVSRPPDRSGRGIGVAPVA